MAVIDEISEITYDWAVDPNLDLIEYEHAALDIFLANARRVDKRGPYIDIPVKIRRLPTGVFEYYDEMSTQSVVQFDVPQTRWRQHYVVISISSQELLETVRMDADMVMARSSLDDLGGENAQLIVNLFAEKIASAPNDLRAELADALWTGSGGDNKQIDSLYDIIYNNTVAYAGVAANAYGTDAQARNFWASYVAGTAGNTDPYTFANVKTDRAAILHGKPVTSNKFYGFVSPDDYGGLEFALQGQQRYNENTTAVRLGFDSISYRNLNFVEDADIADNPISGTSGSGDIAYVNLQTMQMYVDRIWDFKLTKWAKNEYQEAITSRMYFRGQIVCSDRRRNGWRTGISL